MPFCKASGNYTTSKKKQEKQTLPSVSPQEEEALTPLPVYNDKRKPASKFPIIYYSFSTFLLQYKTDFEIYKDKLISS